MSVNQIRHVMVGPRETRTRFSDDMRLTEYKKTRSPNQVQPYERDSRPRSPRGHGRQIDQTASINLLRVM